ncbi:MAG TPA: phosphatase PAP2 family protein [Byssovorax sp.]|jgi:undecaprenyl-diphosphatase
MTFPAAIQAIDESILARARDTPPRVADFFWVLTKIGGGWGLVTAIPFLFRAATRPFAVGLFAAEVAQSALVTLVKEIVSRPRPCDALGWCPAVIVSSPGGPSFPSGHACGTFTFAVFVATLYPRLAIGLLPLAALVAWSRCVLSVHYPSDVAVGAVLGSLIGYGFAKLCIGRFGRPNLQPVALDRAGGAPP